MNPAPSIVFFTTASGAGYGLLFWGGVLRPLGWGAEAPSLGAAAVALALALVTAGLLSSLAHLGNPRRAWRAFSQWRSSWLSREGVAAVLTYPPGLLFLLALWSRWPAAVAAVAGLLSAAGAAATVYCTAMIYASLKTVRQWRHPLVVPCYFAMAAFSGAALLAALAAAWGNARGLPLVAPAALAVLCGLAAIALKHAYWRAVDAGLPGPTAEDATGLGAIGRVRPLDPPHTQQNYLLREM